MKSREVVQLVPRDALHVGNYAVRIVAVSIASGLLVVAAIAVGAEPRRLWWRV